MKRTFVVGAAIGALVVSLAACTFNVHKRDERTIADVKASAGYAERDAQRAIDALLTASTLTARPEDGDALRKRAEEIKALQAASAAFHANWLFREGQKTDE